MKNLVLYCRLLLASAFALAQSNAFPFDGTDDYVEAPSAFTRNSDSTLETWLHRKGLRRRCTVLEKTKSSWILRH